MIRLRERPASRQFGPPELPVRQLVTIVAILLLAAFLEGHWAEQDKATTKARVEAVGVSEPLPSRQRFNARLWFATHRAARVAKPRIMAGPSWACGPITYSVDATGNKYNPNPTALFNSAIAKTEAASGWDFVEVPAGGAVSISWQPRAVFDAFGDRRIAHAYTYASRDSGRIELSDGRYQLERTVMHELGHVLGLMHNSDPTSLMFDGESRVSEWGRGDLKGLASLRSRCR